MSEGVDGSVELDRAIEGRRAYRSLEPVGIPDSLIEDLARTAQLAPSCFNNQPWRFVFVRDPAILERVFSYLTPGNKWARSASMVVAVYSKEELDCVADERRYFLFDTGMATAFMMLKATEQGLVAHPIAGFEEKGVKDVLRIPEGMTLITLILVGRHSATVNPVLSQSQAKSEARRPERKPLDEFVYLDLAEPREASRSGPS